MNAKLRTLEALEACYSNTFAEGCEPSFTESQVLAESFEHLDLQEYEDLLKSAKELLLLNWRFAQRSMLGNFVHSNLFRILLENETIAKHLWSIRNHQDRKTVLEIKSALLDRILDSFSYEMETFLEDFEYSDFGEQERSAFLNCEPTEAIMSVIDICGLVRNLDSELTDEPIDLVYWDAAE